MYAGWCKICLQSSTLYFSKGIILLDMHMNTLKMMFHKSSTGHSLRSASPIEGLMGLFRIFEKDCEGVSVTKSHPFFDASRN